MIVQFIGIEAQEQLSMTDKEICEFINSKDIAKYLFDIHYNFSSLEAAWLINQCKRLNMAQKHAAWTRLINENKDMPAKWAIIKRLESYSDVTSVFELLERCMKLEKELLAEFLLDDEDFVYTYECYSNFDACWTEYDGTIFRNIDILYESIETCNYDAGLYDEDPINCNDIIRITRHMLDMPDFITMDFNINRIPMRLVRDEMMHRGHYDKYYILRIFDDMWFNFPVPFKKGDMVYLKSVGPFELEATTYDHCKEDPKYVGFDTTDMNAWGLFKNKAGVAYHEVTDHLMDLEYYKNDQD